MKKIVKFIVLLFGTSYLVGCQSTILTGALVGGGIGAVVAIIHGQSTDLESVNVEHVSKVVFKDREFTELELTDAAVAKGFVSKIKALRSAPTINQGFYKTIEIVLSRGEIVRVGVYKRYLKSGSKYYELTEELYNELETYF